MTRLIQVDARTLRDAAPAFEPMPPAPEGWRVARPRTTTALAPWFELTPHMPFVDTRVSTGDVGVAASLETFGGVTGPSIPEIAGADHVVVGSALLPPDSAAPTSVEELRRQAGARITLETGQISANRDCLLLVSTVGMNAPLVETFLGRTRLDARNVVGEERLGILVSGDTDLRLDLRLRVAGHTPAARLAILGLQAFLL